MANSFVYNNQQFKVGDTISFVHTIKEGNKTRKQVFRGILIKIKGSQPTTKMITVRKMTRSGIGVEKIVPLANSLISDLKLLKKGNTKRAKLYFIRDLSNKELAQKLYKKQKS